MKYRPFNLLMKIGAYLLAVISLLLGALFILAAFGDTGHLSWISAGVILLVTGLGLIVFAQRRVETTVSVDKVITSLAAGFFIVLGGFLTIYGVGEQINVWAILVGIISTGVGFGLIWFAQGKSKPVVAKNQEPIQVDKPQIERKRQRKVTPILVKGAIILCVFPVCVIVALMALNVVQSFSPKTIAVHYKGASITDMVNSCVEVSYQEPQPWMEPVTGTGDVLALYYEYQLPFPDSYSAYDFYIEMDPELISEGQELLIPSASVQPFLIKTCGYPPKLCCSTDLQGNIRFIETGGEELKAWLEVGEIYVEGSGKGSWKYNGEANYKQAPLPK